MVIGLAPVRNTCIVPLAQRQSLQAFLYSRPGAWPQLRAPFEPLALLVVLGRLLVSWRAETWFRRSLIKQSAAPPP
jgi:hypothetical protein